MQRKLTAGLTAWAIGDGAGVGFFMAWLLCCGLLMGDTMMSWDLMLVVMVGSVTVG